MVDNKNQRLQGLGDFNHKAASHHYTRFVKGLRLFLPLMAIGILAIVIVWPQLTRIEQEPLTKQDLTALEQAETRNILKNPIFNTQDAKGRPITITATEANQNRAGDTRVLLIGPTAKIRDNNDVLTIQAEEGFFDPTANIIQLKNNVILTTPMGTIEGQEVILDNRAQKTIFHGRTKAVINQ